MRFPTLLVALLACSSNALADVVTLTGSRDNTIWNDPAGQVSNGQGPIMIVGRAAPMAQFPVRRGLLRFDVAGAVPAGSTILSAQLVLEHPSGNASPQNVQLHRVFGDWGEGASNTTSGQGAPAQAGDATWIHRFFPGSNWLLAGGDFTPLPSATLTVFQFGTQTWPSSLQVVTDVQGWLDLPTSNHGWLLKLDLESLPMTTKVFSTREDPNPLVRPKLVVTYDPPPIIIYCTTQTTSNGCVPGITSSGTPSASAGSGFTVALPSTINRKFGLFCYGFGGPIGVPFLGGFLCVAPPIRRIPQGSSGGNAGSDCSGSFAIDVNTLIATGNDPLLVVGAVVYAQWLSRDPGNPLGSSNVSNALHFAILP